MYVVTDIEWAVNKEDRQSLTQIAATKVDEQWNPIASYSSFIRPQNESFEDWSQVCYNGAKPNDFRYAQSAYSVLQEFDDWLNDDDILLFWYQPSCDLFKQMHRILFKKETQRQCIAVAEYVTAFIGKKQTSKVNPYKLATRVGISVPSVVHLSKNDVRVVLSLLKKADLQQHLLLSPPPKAKHKVNLAICPYVYDPKTKLLHKNGCPSLPQNTEVKGYTTIETCLKKDYKGCSVCGMIDELKEARKNRNINILERALYNYVYIEKSNIFHRPSCHLIWNTKDTILGSVNFNTVWQTGREPCKICKPTKYDTPKPININALRAGAAKARSKPRPTSQDEKRALGRYKQAKQERNAALNDISLSESEKQDIYTLTQPEFAFWTAQGYSTFHIRSCAKLAHMQHYKGFKYYDQAIKAGYTPCKMCKPSPKHNIKLSIPLGNERRTNDTIENLIKMCEEAGYQYIEDKLLFTIITPVGKWRIHTQVSPIKVDHSNLVGGGGYHQQPRVFLSLFDTFFYINRHDSKLYEKSKSQK